MPEVCVSNCKRLDEGDLRKSVRKEFQIGAREGDCFQILPKERIKSKRLKNKLTSSLWLLQLKSGDDDAPRLIEVFERKTRKSFSNFRQVLNFFTKNHATRCDDAHNWWHGSTICVENLSQILEKVLTKNLKTKRQSPFWTLTQDLWTGCWAQIHEVIPKKKIEWFIIDLHNKILLLLHFYPAKERTRLWWWSFLILEILNKILLEEVYCEVVWCAWNGGKSISRIFK